MVDKLLYCYVMWVEIANLATFILQSKKPSLKSKYHRFNFEKLLCVLENRFHVSS